MKNITLRSILLGFLGAALICGLTFFNDRVLRQTYMVGNYMPVFVYGSLFIVTAFINPLFGKSKLNASEFAVIMLMMLVPCAVPSSGFLRTFAPALLLPHHYIKTIPSWRTNDVLSLLPKRMMPDLTDEERVLGGFIQGLSTGNSHIGISEVPWQAWINPLMFWVPILLSLIFACLAIAVILHKQWADNEHLQYPVAMFADAMLPQEDGSKSVFSKRMFWVAMLTITLIYINNYLCQWFPEYLIPVRLRLPLSDFNKVFPTIGKGGGWGLFAPQLYFSVIAIAYLVPGDVSLAFGLGPWLWALMTGTLLNYGISMEKMVEGGTTYTAPRPRSFMQFGSNVAYFIVMMYTGRHYYRKVIEAIFGKKNDEVAPGAAWAGRCAILFIASFILLLVFQVGIDWQLAVIYTSLLLMFYVVLGRIVCESGLFHVQPGMAPCVIVWGILGASNLGPKTIFLLQMVSIMFSIDPRETIMPYVMNTLKLVQKHRQPLGKTTSLAASSLVLGLFIAVAASLYFQYDYGFGCTESWANNSVPIMQPSNAVAITSKLKAQDALEYANNVSGWARFRHINPNPLCTWSFVIGMALVFAFCFAKLRYTWWPLSPLLLVTWNTSHLHAFAGSFLIGWLIKKLVLKFGGSQTFNDLKPIMIGLITGEIMASFIPSVFAFIYYFITGETPMAFHVFLG